MSTLIKIKTMKTLLTIFLFLLSFTINAQTILKTDSGLIISKSNTNISITSTTTIEKAANEIADKIPAKTNTTFFDKSDNPCLVIAYFDNGSSKTSYYEVTGYEPHNVLLSTTKIMDVRKYCRFIILKQLK